MALFPVVKGAQIVYGIQWQNNYLNYHLQTLVTKYL